MSVFSYLVSLRYASVSGELAETFVHGLAYWLSGMIILSQSFQADLDNGISQIRSSFNRIKNGIVAESVFVIGLYFALDFLKVSFWLRALEDSR